MITDVGELTIHSPEALLPNSILVKLYHAGEFCSAGFFLTFFCFISNEASMYRYLRFFCSVIKHW